MTGMPAHLAWEHYLVVETYWNDSNGQQRDSERFQFWEEWDSPEDLQRKLEASIRQSNRWWSGWHRKVVVYGVRRRSYDQVPLWTGAVFSSGDAWWTEADD